MATSVGQNSHDWCDKKNGCTPDMTGDSNTWWKSTCRGGECNEENLLHYPSTPASLLRRLGRNPSRRRRLTLQPSSPLAVAGGPADGDGRAFPWILRRSAERAMGAAAGARRGAGRPGRRPRVAGRRLHPAARASAGGGGGGFGAAGRWWPSRRWIRRRRGAGPRIGPAAG
ncbi:hypothetical protein BRADI_1g54525v3 [Brachypodium distachyon]|uniref:Uncharacterized protein n=1 Tax=Brachypodium distachyon TaxID=15368 RepID=A0A2K2DRE3_BRADI|nr:hypothetical protein BRADI_1g54525v3 [Brachypodium distachyon]